MAQRLLYVREHPLDLPDLVIGREAMTVNNAPDAISSIDRFGETIDGYVLGLYLLHPGITPEYVEGVLARIRDFKVNPDIHPKERNTELLLRKHDAKKHEYHSCFDSTGGEKVFRYLEKRGYVGKKPILFFTSQEDVNPIVKADGKRNIRVASIPISSEQFAELFYASFGR